MVKLNKLIKKQLRIRLGETIAWQLGNESEIILRNKLWDKLGKQLSKRFLDKLCWELRKKLEKELN
jgi:hypothetical protein